MFRKIIEFIDAVKEMYLINLVDNMCNLTFYDTKYENIFKLYDRKIYIWSKKNININFKLSIIDECQICLENTQLYSFTCHDKYICCFYCRTEVEGKTKTFEQLIFETILISYYNHFILNKF